MSKKSRSENLKILQEFDNDSSDSDEESNDAMGEMVRTNFINNLIFCLIFN